MSDSIIYENDYDNILKIIKKKLSVNVSKKELYGEVFTPIIFIEEIINNIPNNIWNDPNLKWLDPACGIGNFPIIIYKKLMNTLKNYNKNGLNLTDKYKRHSHIINNMIYMVEIENDNVSSCYKIFGKESNIYKGSFLNNSKQINDDILKYFSINKFDIIIGNPPYQNERIKKKGTTAGRSKIWDSFVKNSFNILKDDGFLCFIHPSSWRGPQNKLWDLMKNKQIIYLHLYSVKDGQNIFNVGTRFDLYVLHNKPTYKKTKVIDEVNKHHKILLNKLPFLANYNYHILNKIITTEEKGVDVIFDTFYHSSDTIGNTKKNKDAIYNKPVVHSVNKHGLGLIYTNKKVGHFGKPKVILNSNIIQYSYPEQNDYTGKYGMSQLSFGLPIKSKKEGDDILNIIDTDVFKQIIKSTKWSLFQTDYKMFKYFKKDWYKILKKERGTGTKKIVTNNINKKRFTQKLKK
tara:strand:- start:103 stop:1485 length:1383 start_codon:yes stop_codon:yes gene_type:complete